MRLILQSISSLNQLGQVFSEDFSDLAQWTVVGVNDYLVSGNELTVSGSSVSDYSKYIYSTNFVTNFRRLNFTYDLVIKDLSGKIAIGGKSANAWIQNEKFIEYDFTAGQLTVYRYANGKTNITGGDTLPVQVGDTVSCSFASTLTANSITVTNNRTEVSKTYPFGAIHSGNIYRIAIYSIGGSTGVKNLSVVCPYAFPSPISFIGDSITTGHGVEETTFAYLVGRNYRGYSKCSGPADRSTELILALPQIKLLKPKISVVLIGTNDLGGGGVTKATWLANLEQINTELSAFGTVYFCTITPRNDAAATVVDWNTSLTSTFTNVIDIHTGLKTGTNTLHGDFDRGDGLHINEAGRQLIATTISSAI